MCGPSSVAHDDWAKVWFSERLRWRRRHTKITTSSAGRPDTTLDQPCRNALRSPPCPSISPSSLRTREVCLRTPLARTKPCEVIVLHGNTNAAARPRAKDTEMNMMFRASLNMRDEKPRSPAVLRSQFSSNSRPAPMGTTHHGPPAKPRSEGQIGCHRQTWLTIAARDDHMRPNAQSPADRLIT